MLNVRAGILFNFPIYSDTRVMPCVAVISIGLLQKLYFAFVGVNLALETQNILPSFTVSYIETLSVYPTN